MLNKLRTEYREWQDVLSYSGEKGSAMTAFAAFQAILMEKIFGRKIFTLWGRPNQYKEKVE